jgi:peptidoglycan/LPS O-acetylase OafA/YrhL
MIWQLLYDKFFAMNKTELPNHIDSIDGLRGIASLMVLLHHCYYHGGGFKWPMVGNYALSQLLFYG